MNLKDKVVLTCALNGVLTDPKTHPVPFRPNDMAQAAWEAEQAGAAVVHIHLREQQNGIMPSWEPDLAENIIAAISHRCPKMIINMTTGVLGNDLSGPLGVLRRVRPEIAAMNAGSLNYLKTRSNGNWAWPPMLFDNPIDKIEKFLQVMTQEHIIPECECFDTGIVRSVSMFERNGLLQRPYTVSLVQGVASGMPARPELLELLLDELPQGVPWQSIVIGRQEVWPLHRRTAELGGNLRTGLEDTFYLPSGDHAKNNGQLIEALANVAREAGREPATCDEARQLMGIKTN